MRHFVSLKRNKTILLLLIASILALAAAVTWISTPGGYPEKGKLSFYAFDVGQGDSSLFVLPDGGTILIDAGPQNAGGKLIGEIRKLGVKKIDLLIATHPHSDHIGGMDRILSDFPVRQVWDSGYIHGSQLQNKFYASIKKMKIPLTVPRRGHSEMMGGTVIDVLAPAMPLKGTRSDANNNCLVVKITYGSTSFLMAADMEREERATISPLPRASVLKASHHGSANGTDSRLLREIRPYFIILSYAKGNSYGYPHKEVVRDVASMGIKRLDTKDGTVWMKSDGKSITYPKNREVRTNVD